MMTEAPPADRLELLADAAYFALQLERKLAALTDSEPDGRWFRVWDAGHRGARQLRSVLLAERRRHLARARSNRQRTRRRRETAR
jgi:hypothetical protein